MTETPARNCVRHFVSYSGMKLPLKLVEPIAEGGLGNRNTWFRAEYDAQERVIAIDKVVYGEVGFAHRYAYADDGRLVRAEITDAEGETTSLEF